MNDDSRDVVRPFEKSWTEEEKARVPNWTSREQVVVNAEMLRLPFGAARTREQVQIMLSCGFCMKLPDVGDGIRWLLVSGAPNTFVCSDCDSDDAEDRWPEFWKENIKPILQRWSSVV